MAPKPRPVLFAIVFLAVIYLVLTLVPMHAPRPWHGRVPSYLKR